jgi:MOSC N-terminal beta barrel domain
LGRHHGQLERPSLKVRPVRRIGREDSNHDKFRVDFFGVAEELWRYPVKSMLGEQLGASEVTESGLLGDRVYALRDLSDGKIATAKNPRKWPNLFDYE